MKASVMPKRETVTSTQAPRAVPARDLGADEWGEFLWGLSWCSGVRRTARGFIGANTVANPGGTVYLDGSTDIYYPHHNDWGNGRRMHFATMDVIADALGFDNLASQKGAYWETYHAQKVLDMQNRYPDGHTYAGRYYDANSEDTYPGREDGSPTTPAGHTWPAGSNTRTPSPPPTRPTDPVQTSTGEVSKEVGIVEGLLDGGGGCGVGGFAVEVVVLGHGDAGVT
jgi:hypothetical protein